MFFFTMYNNCIMYIYGLITTLLFLIFLPFIYIVRAINGKFLYGWREKLGFFSAPDLGDKVIMYHGVSVGEVIALENLIKATKNNFPDYKLVVTTGTKTGQDIAHKKYGEIADFITYFPFDIPFCVNRFLSKVNPTVVLIAETELWPTFAYNCKKRNIPLYVINGRISDSTYRTYKMFSFFFKQILKNYSGIYTQSDYDNQKLINIGADADKTQVMKNLKFDVKRSPDKISMGTGRIIIAGSTHQGEDEIVLKAFVKLKKEFSDVKLLLAPRHPKRVPQVVELVKNTGMSYGLRSQNDNFESKDIVLLDTLGELGKMYQICDFAFIGGSFNKTGGHNPLEAVVYSKPVVSGPSIHNFRDIYGILSRSKAGKVVKTAEELELYMEKLLSDDEFYKSACQDCETVFNDQQGAMQFVIDKLKQILN